MFEFFFRHDGHLVGILCLLKCGYIVLVECVKVLCVILLFFSRVGSVVWDGGPLDFAWGLLDRKGLVMGIGMDLKFPFEEEESFGCGGSKGCLICEFWELDRPVIMVTTYLVSPLVDLAQLSKVIEGLNKLFSYACEVVWEYGRGVDAKDFGVEVGEYVVGVGWNFICFSWVSLLRIMSISLVSSLDKGTP